MQGLGGKNVPRVPEGRPEERRGTQRVQGHVTEGPQTKSNCTLGAALILFNELSRKDEVGVQGNT